MGDLLWRSPDDDPLPPSGNNLIKKQKIRCRIDPLCVYLIGIAANLNFHTTRRDNVSGQALLGRLEAASPHLRSDEASRAVANLPTTKRPLVEESTDPLEETRAIDRHSTPIPMLS